MSMIARKKMPSIPFDFENKAKSSINLKKTAKFIHVSQYLAHILCSNYN